MYFSCNKSASSGVEYQCDMMFAVLSASLLLPGLLSLPFHTVTLTMPDNEVTINVNRRERGE